jgi:hypothetical protein
MSQTIFTIHFGILFVIASLHIYWAMGGKTASLAVLPQSSSEKQVFMPSSFITLIVAISFYMMSLIYGHAAGFFQVSILKNYQNAILIVLGIVFLIRAIGDFKYVGFTKKIKGTPFSINDTKYYTPLCFSISITTFLAIYFL